MAGLALCEEVVGRSAALRAALYARAQALQLLKASLVCEPVDMSFFTTQGAPPKAPIGVPDAGNDEPTTSAPAVYTAFVVQLEATAVLSKH